MTVFFLGTGAAEGLPALFCDCEICVEAHARGGKNLRTRSTILIDDYLKIDLPPDTLAHVHAYPACLANLKHLLFTHSDDDHFAIRELQYLSPNFAPGRKAPLDVYGPDPVMEKIGPSMSHCFEKAPLRLHSLAPFEPVEIGEHIVTPIVAHHKQDELCFNYFVTGGSDGKTLLYGSDTGWYDAPTWQFLAGKRIDTVILECGKGDSTSTYDGHLNIEEAIRVRRQMIASDTIASDTPFYLTHVAHTGLLLHEEMTERVAPHGMLVAYDGLSIGV